MHQHKHKRQHTPNCAIPLPCRSDTREQSTKNEEARSGVPERASLILAAIYSRGTYRPTKRPAAPRRGRLRSSRQGRLDKCASICPEGARRRGAAPSQPSTWEEDVAATKRTQIQNEEPDQALA